MVPGVLNSIAHPVSRWRGSVIRLELLLRWIVLISSFTWTFIPPFANTTVDHRLILPSFPVDVLVWRRRAQNTTKKITTSTTYNLFWLNRFDSSYRWHVAFMLFLAPVERIFIPRLLLLPRENPFPALVWRTTALCYSSRKRFHARVVRCLTGLVLFLTAPQKKPCIFQRNWWLAKNATMMRRPNDDACLSSLVCRTPLI